MIEIVHSAFSTNVQNAIFSIKKMKKDGEVSITKIVMYQNGKATKTVYGNNPKIVEKIQDLKLKNHFLNYNKESSSNFLAIEYFTANQDGQILFSDTLYVYDNGFYCDIVAEPFPIWERQADLYPLIKELLDED